MEILWDRGKNLDFWLAFEFLGVGSIEVTVGKCSVRLTPVKPDKNNQMIYTYRHILCAGTVYGIVKDSSGNVFSGNNLLKTITIID